MRMFPTVVLGVLLSFAILGGRPTAFGQEKANLPTAADRPPAVDKQSPVDGIQVADDETLVALVETSYKLQQSGDWAEYARLIDTADLRRFQTRFTPLLRIPGKGAGLLALFDGGPDVKTVLAWSPEEFFARFMRGTLASVPAGPVPQETKRQMLGIVREGTAQAHAVVRVERNMVSLTTTRMEVVSLRRDAGGWKLAMPDELAGMAEMLTLSMLGPAQAAESTRASSIQAADAAQPE
ncbi:MAG: hypothetical protein MUF06_13320 [Pirellulaceae bacterium]|nr:hypothetical protein [Pirellulaceae bacterium]